MFTSTCPKCGSIRADVSHSMAIVCIKHKNDCGYMLGQPTTFNAVEVKSTSTPAPQVDPNVIIKDETTKVETQPVEKTSGETAEQK